jgi:hypothetical protein
MKDHTRFLRKYIWKTTVPLKIKISMWFLHRKVLLKEPIWLKVIGMVVTDVAFVIKMS